MSGEVLNWSGVITPAEGELTDDEIEQRYGTLLRGAVSAFRDDPSYIIDMAESASMLRYKRELNLARQSAATQTDDKEEIAQIAQQIMEERGLFPPQRSVKKRTHRAA